MMGRMAATSRDPEEWARATEAARRTRQEVAEEVARTIGAQVAALIVEGDVMGGRSRLAGALRDVAAAERRGDPDALRAALMGGIEAMGSWVAALDYVPPELARANGSSTRPTPGR
jgi:hypothetical protein